MLLILGYFYSIFSAVVGSFWGLILTAVQQVPSIVHPLFLCLSEEVPAIDEWLGQVC